MNENEILAAIDRFIVDCSVRSIVPSSEVIDFLLDLRLIAEREEIPV